MASWRRQPWFEGASLIYSWIEFFTPSPSTNGWDGVGRSGCGTDSEGERDARELRLTRGLQREGEAGRHLNNSHESFWVTQTLATS